MDEFTLCLSVGVPSLSESDPLAPRELFNEKISLLSKNASWSSSSERSCLSCSSEESLGLPSVLYHSEMIRIVNLFQLAKIKQHLKHIIFSVINYILFQSVIYINILYMKIDP